METREVNYLPDEIEISNAYGGNLVLTSHRVRLDIKNAGESQVQSILLDQVASCGLMTKSNLTLLVLAAAVFVLAVLAKQITTAVILGGLLAALYWFTRKESLSIASAGGAIEIATSGLDRKVLLEFIDAVEAAKHTYTMKSSLGT